jgi:hypothetical protein
MRIFGRQGEDLGPEVPISSTLDLSAERIEAIVAAADRAVADIQAEAAALRGSEPSNGSRISRQRLVADLADSLVARAEGLRREAAELSGVLTRASDRLREADEAANGLSPYVGAEASRADDPATIEAAEPTAPPAPPHEGLRAKVADRFTSGERAAHKDRRSSFRRRSTAVPRDRSEPVPSAEGLKLLATQMAVAGSNRDEIEDRLRHDFGIEDVGELLGDVRTGSTESRGTTSG